MTDYPRGVEARLQWMVDNEPGEAGQCAYWTWMALGDGVDPARWSCPDANSVVEKTRDAGDLYTTGTPPRGAIVLYTSSTYGHMCLAKGDGDIMSTDPYGDWGATGTMPQEWPVDNWGQKYAGWSQRYSGTLLPMTEPGKVYVDKLVQGQQDSDSVKRLQDVLNHTSLPAPGNVFLPVQGFYGEDTQTVVQVWQEENGYPKGPIDNAQADALFAGTGHTVVHADTGPEPEPEPPDPNPVPPSSSSTDLSWHHYSGKPSGTLTVADDAGYVLVDADTPDPPVDGLEWHMLYANCDLTWDSGSQDGWIRVKYVREGDDPTAYQDFSVVRGLSDFLITAQHWEAGQAGVGGRWWINVGGGISKVVVGTRYVKGGGVPAELDTTTALSTRVVAPAALILAVIAIILSIITVS